MKFLLLFGRLNLAFLTPEKRNKAVKKYRLISTEAVELFEYEKNNDGYLDEAKLYNQVIKKALSIAEVFYSG